VSERPGGRFLIYMALVGGGGYKIIYKHCFYMLAAGMRHGCCVYAVYNAETERLRVLHWCIGSSVGVGGRAGRGRAMADLCLRRRKRSTKYGKKRAQIYPYI
jgi:hypothetical protein